MGTNPQDGAGPEYFLTQGCATDHQETSEETGGWYLGIPLIGEAMMESGLEGIRTYVTRRQNTIAQYISMRPIMDLCDRSARRPWAWVSRWWW